MIRLDDIALFVSVASTGSFSASARVANMLPAQVSVAVKRLEAALGVELFVRTTRLVRLTGKGEQYLPHAREILCALRTGRDSALGIAGGYEGDLTLGMSPHLARGFLSPWLAAFHREHPRLRVCCCVCDPATPSPATDALLHYGAQPGSANEIIAIHCERILVASPGYLADHGTPARLDDLRNHACITAPRDNGEVWEVTESGVLHQLPVSGMWCSDDGDLVRRWALQGHGIAFRPRIEIDADLSSGRLIRIFNHVAGPSLPLALSHRRGAAPIAALQGLASWLRNAAERYAGRALARSGAAA